VMRIMGMEPSEQQLQELIQSVDVDGNGKVSGAPAHAVPPTRTARTPPVRGIGTHGARGGGGGGAASCTRAWLTRRVCTPVPCALQIELEEFTNLMARNILTKDGAVGRPAA
jgi:hypothetical protein